MKKMIKYGSRFILALFTIFWGLITLAALFPDESYHHCEAGQEELSTLQCVMAFVISLIVFCVVWYKTSE